ncbi:carbonate dehydratase [Thiomicrospira aerophila AL3]|uniref:carbonic anhydrase n=1 Tax=Thiomicrospira aerophila AL3 TaxID=717772 RepID=W0DTC9_9GAMM|nr:carbonic anhydrase family protein [Thiomicrospira aerophila]AHF01672.1 carbonate dehydratase [Thiomicrospira aerophila AL3]
MKGVRQWLGSLVMMPFMLPLIAVCSLPAYANLLDLEAEFQAFQAQNPELVTDNGTATDESARNAASPEATEATTAAEPLTAAPAPAPAQPEVLPDWSYQGDNGPDAWGSLHEAFRCCQRGRAQSPVNLVTEQAASVMNLSELATDYRAMPLRLQKSSARLVSPIPLGSPLIKAGSQYQLLEVQFKTPSEHQLDGFNYPLEIQFHHRDGEGQALVVSVLVKEGQRHPQLEQILNHLPRDADRLRIYEGVPFQPINLWPRSRDYFRYLGSQTQPPCEEGVVWVVMREPIEASIRQILGFQDVLGHNARPIQPLNGRLPLKSWQDAPIQPTQTQQDSRRLDGYRGYFFSF